MYTFVYESIILMQAFTGTRCIWTFMLYQLHARMDARLPHDAPLLKILKQYRKYLVSTLISEGHSIPPASGWLGGSRGDAHCKKCFDVKHGFDIQSIFDVKILTEEVMKHNNSNWL